MPRFPVNAVKAVDAPTPAGPYSHAAGHDPQGALCLSGQTPIDPATNRLVDGDVGDVGDRARRVL